LATADGGDNGERRPMVGDAGIVAVRRPCKYTAVCTVYLRKIANKGDVTELRGQVSLLQYFVSNYDLCGHLGFSDDLT